MNTPDPDQYEDSSAKWFVRRESRRGLSLPSIKSWNACHSLIYAPSGDIDAPDSVWVGFFINRQVAEKVKSVLESTVCKHR